MLVASSSAGDGADSPEDNKAQARWYKASLPAFAAVCRGYVYIEDDPARRAAVAERAAALATVFPIPVRVTANREEALHAAADLWRTGP